MWTRLAAAGPVWYDPRALANHREHPAATTSRTSAQSQMVDGFRTVADAMTLLAPDSCMTVARLAIARLMYGHLRNAIVARRTRRDGSDIGLLAALILRHWPDAKQRDEIAAALNVN